MAKRKVKDRPRDPNQLAKMIADIATGEVNDDGSFKLTEKGEYVVKEVIVIKKNQAAVELGRLGGLKGGKARAAKLTSEERKAIAKKAAAKRWGKK